MVHEDGIFFLTVMQSAMCHIFSKIGAVGWLIPYKDLDREADTVRFREGD